MSSRVVVPHLSANALDVTVGAWFVQPGGRVRAGEPLLEVSTDKAAFEIEAPADGLLLANFAPTRSVVPVGFVLALIGEAGATDPAIEADNEALMESYRQSLAGETVPTEGGVSENPVGYQTTSQAAPAAEAGGAPAASAAVRATPKVKRLAREQGINLTEVQSSTGAAIITEAVLNDWIDQKKA